jgi:hypothetical protein
MPTPSNLAQVRELLKTGKVQEADDLLAKEEESAAAAAGAAPAKPVEPPPPRAPEVILHDFMVAVADRFGNHHVLESLANEFESVTARPEKA